MRSLKECMRILFNHLSWRPKTSLSMLDLEDALQTGRDDVFWDGEYCRVSQVWKGRGQLTVTLRGHNYAIYIEQIAGAVIDGRQIRMKR